MGYEVRHRCIGASPSSNGKVVELLQLRRWDDNNYIFTFVFTSSCRGFHRQRGFTSPTEKRRVPFCHSKMVSPRNSGAIERAAVAPSPPTIMDEKTAAAVGQDAKGGDAHVMVEAHNDERFQIRDFLDSTRRLFTKQGFLQACAVLVKFGKFMGPGSIIAVAYIDPDNFQTAVSSGAEFKYKLLFMVLVSNLIAIYLQVSSDQPMGGHTH